MNVPQNIPLKIIQQPKVTSYAGDNASVLNCVITYNKYGGYCAPLSSIHRPVPQTLFSGDVWEPDTIDYMVQHVGKGDIIHAGTYFGDLVPALSRGCAPGAKVWAFEPNPENYRCAQITTLLNRCDNVVLRNAGLGSENGTLPMLVKDVHGNAVGGASRLVGGNAEYDKNLAVDVEVCRLDDVIPADRHISILQLDVEGHELPALNGAMGIIRRCKPILIVEFMVEPKYMADHLTPLGYAHRGRLHMNHILSVSA